MCNNCTYRGNHMIYIIIALTIHCCIRVDIPENKRDTQVHNLKDLKGSLRHAKRTGRNIFRNMSFGHATLIGFGISFIVNLEALRKNIFLSISIPRA